MAEDDPLAELLVNLHSLMVDMERHLDLAARGDDPTQLGRAWVSAARIERLLRSALPADTITEDIERAVDQANEAGVKASHASRSEGHPPVSEQR